MSTPAGILTVRSLVTRVFPAPLHSEHGSFIIVPVPLHAPHGLATLKNPCWNLTCPAPLHVGHVADWVPGLAPVPEQTAQSAVSSFRAEGRILEGYIGSYQIKPRSGPGLRAHRRKSELSEGPVELTTSPLFATIPPGASRPKRSCTSSRICGLSGLFSLNSTL